jgi:hypothetical protein
LGLPKCRCSEVGCGALVYASHGFYCRRLGSFVSKARREVNGCLERKLYRDVVPGVSIGSDFEED